MPKYRIEWNETMTVRYLADIEADSFEEAKEAIEEGDEDSYEINPVPAEILPMGGVEDVDGRDEPDVDELSEQDVERVKRVVKAYNDIVAEFGPRLESGMTGVTYTLTHSKMTKLGTAGVVDVTEEFYGNESPDNYYRKCDLDQAIKQWREDGWLGLHDSVALWDDHPSVKATMDLAEAAPQSWEAELHSHFKAAMVNNDHVLLYADDDGELCANKLSGCTPNSLCALIKTGHVLSRPYTLIPAGYEPDWLTQDDDGKYVVDGEWDKKYDSVKEMFSELLDHAEVDWVQQLGLLSEYWEKAEQQR
jgi:hypothetical protein